MKPQRPADRFRVFDYHSSCHEWDESYARKGFQRKGFMTAKKMQGFPPVENKAFGELFFVIFTQVACG